MSTTSINSSGALGVSGSLLTNDGATGNLQLTGLASGLNTNEIIQAELAVQELPLQNMEEEISAMNTENQQLSVVQDDLQNLSLDAWSLGEPSLFFQVQNVSSSNSNLVTAATSDGLGAVIGSTEVTVSQLASASQRTFDVAGLTTATATTTAADNMSIDGTTVSIAAGSTIDDIAEQINNDDSLDVYASVNAQNQLVLSGRSTGNLDDSSDTYIHVVDGTDSDGSGGTVVSGDGGTESSVGSGPLLTEVTSAAQDGQNAEYTVNGVAGSSTTDTAVNAIPGVTLTLTGVTGSTPVTITTSAPGPDTANILAAVQTFVNDYNSMISSIESAINTLPASAQSESTSSEYSPYTGSLFGDDQLEDLVNQLRESVDDTFSGLPSSLNSLASIGVSTGTSTGSATASSTDGLLTINTSQLEAAIQSNPSGVENVLSSFSSSFQTVANDAGSPTGSLQARITGNDTEITQIQSQLTSETTMFNQEEENEQEEWASVESTLESLDDQKTSLTTFADNLSTSSSSSSS